MGLPIRRMMAAPFGLIAGDTDIIGPNF